MNKVCFVKWIIDRVDGGLKVAVNLANELSDKYEIDSSDFALKLTIAFKNPNPIHSDFIKTLNLGIETYPTAVLEKEGEFYDLRGYATEPEDIEIHFNLITKRF